jgi:hypothetical protein
MTLPRNRVATLLSTATSTAVIVAGEFISRATETFEGIAIVEPGCGNSGSWLVLVFDWQVYQDVCVSRRPVNHFIDTLLQ